MAALAVYRKPTLIRGVRSNVDCVDIGGQVFTLSTGAVRVLRLEDEWYEDVAEPAAIVESLQRDRPIADLFTFWQRVPDLTPRHDYPVEWENIAVLPVSSHKAWWDRQIKSRVRNQIRKAQKEGLEVRESAYDDAFVQGMTGIFNESPVRQGRPFWHYGKDFDTVKEQFSRFIHRERMIGAYVDDRMVGFMMIANAGPFALVGQILSRVAERDRQPNQAMMSKAVEMCAEDRLPYLVYLFWSDDSLSEFKRRCGFECVRVPRYCVPLTRRGALAIRLGLQHGLVAALPPSIKAPLKRLRNAWHERRSA